MSQTIPSHVMHILQSNKNNLGHGVRPSAFYSQDLPKLCHLATKRAFLQHLCLAYNDGGGRGAIGGVEIEGEKGINGRAKKNEIKLDFSLNSILLHCIAPY